ncbi:MAG TPA: hypothetical protein PLK34_01805 [Candidatus Pacearchaeota archaeon]|nr:hypothetical protein [Candidatus Pacearchaeota archaeon]
MEFPKIFDDEFYIKCINLATSSKGNERYGSILVLDSKIIGEGYNRAIVHPALEKLERRIRQGMANHAEIEALNDALFKGNKTENSDVYVAGYFPNSKRLFFKTEYTCVKCLPHLRNYEISNIYVPTPGGWIKKDLNEAYEEAKKFVNGTHQKRLEAMRGEFYISQLNL